MKRFKAWLAGVWAAAKVDEKKIRRYLTALAAIVVTAALQVFDVGVDAIVAMDGKQLVKRFIVCLAFGVIGALAHGGPLKAIQLATAPDPAAVLSAVADAQKGATTATPPPAPGAPSAT